jgi:GR25 family glycosyltransferase involved in LPS biosynthesis
MIGLDVYIISLPFREDRCNLAVEELLGLGVQPNQIKIQQAKFTPRNGAIGCAYSHAFALSRFLFESNSEFCLFVEDDIEILNKESASQAISQALVADMSWDVLLLASNVSYAVEKTKQSNLFRVLNAQTCSAYVVTRNFAPKLVKLFYEAAEHMSSVPLSLDDNNLNFFYAIDMIWKSSQINNRFLAFLPQLFKQRPSFSDIENKLVSYGV